MDTLRLVLELSQEAMVLAYEANLRAVRDQQIARRGDRPGPFDRA
jgi:hypothetical protein